MRRRDLIGIGALLAVLLATALFARTRGADGPEGFSALRRLLELTGTEVREGDRPRAGDGTFLLLEDLRDDDEAAEIIRWVDGGGTLVLADPLSSVARSLGIEPALGRAPTAPEPACLAPPAIGVERLAVQRSDRPLVPGPGGVGCFPREDGAPFAVWHPRGRGAALVLGGVSPLTNELLRREDNAAFVLTTMRSPVVFGAPAPATAGDSTLWGSLPPAARAVILQLAGAVGLFAAMRARRLGRPVVEDIPSPIPAGELVRATGRLYRSARAADHAGELLRRAAAERLGRRLGAQPGGSRRDLAAMIARASGIQRERIQEVLDGEAPGDDRSLLALAKGLDEIRAAMEGPHR